MPVKDEIKKQAKRWALRAAMPYILWALGIIFAVLCVIGLVILVMTSMCQGWTVWGISKVSGVVGPGDFCKAFEPFQPIMESLDKAQAQPVDYSKTPTQ